MRRARSSLSLTLIRALVVISLPGSAACARRGSADTEPARYLVLVGLDGVRHDYLDRYEPPTLVQMAREGVRADALIPPFPSLTFPSFYSIATGLYPERHGIIANAFPDLGRDRQFSLSDREAVQDGTWYGGEPIWVTAERQGVRTAAFFYPGTEADVGGLRPSEWRTYDASVSYDERVDTVLGWLARPEAERPRLVTMYFSAVDSAGHDYGPDADEVATAVARVDAAVGRLQDGLRALPFADDIYLMVLSDHGMLAIAREELLARTVDLRGMRTVGLGPNLAVHTDPGRPGDPARAARLRDQLNDTLVGGRAFLRGELPAHLHARAQPLFGDVIVVAAAGTEVRRSARTGDPPAGMHGWDPATVEMHGIFLLTGPDVPAGRRIPAFENVHIYPLLARLLGIEPSPGVDGQADLLAEQVVGTTP